jgi:hypothetical protein
MRLTLAAVTTRLAGQGHRPAWITPGQARRQDPMTALVCAAVDGLGPPRDPATGVIVGTAWGTVEATLRLADSISDYGDVGSSPTAFITSVHHHPAGGLGELLGLHGPTNTVSMGACSGLGALRTAGLLLAQGRCPAVLVIAADLPNPWWTVAAQKALRRPVGGGVVAMLATPGGPGWSVEFPPIPGISVLPPPANPWWPTAALAQAPWDGVDPFTIREQEGRHVLSASFQRQG